MLCCAADEQAQAGRFETWYGVEQAVVSLNATSSCGGIDVMNYIVVCVDFVSHIEVFLD